MGGDANADDLVDDVLLAERVAAGDLACHRVDSATSSRCGRFCAFDFAHQYSDVLRRRREDHRRRELQRQRALAIDLVERDAAMRRMIARMPACAARHVFGMLVALEPIVQSCVIGAVPVARRAPS